ncbi:MAG: hypothetical protein ACRDP1_09415 [Nocardioidaceae bacterium]
MNDERLLGLLRAEWERNDPVPDGLVERTLVAIETRDLDIEYELLRMLESSGELAGTRGARTDTVTMTFSGQEITVMIHVAPLDGGRRRVDGWVAPMRPLQVAAIGRNGSTLSEVEESGRFAFDDLPAGMTRFALSPVDAGALAGEPAFVTPTVEL